MSADRGLAALAERLGALLLRSDPILFDPQATAAAILGDSGRFSPDGGLDATRPDPDAGPWKCSVCGGLGSHTTIGVDGIPDHAFRPPEGEP